MDNNQKAHEYNRMMHEYDLIQNKINQIKGSSFELNEQQEREIGQLKIQQGRIQQMVERLMML